jgi:hypothetical protein
MTATEDKGAAPNRIEASQPSFVPPSLFRVRQFLFEQGMQIVPWSSTDEVLDELHLLLQTHKADDSFWQSLRELFVALNLDLQRLLPSSTRQNEVLELATREALLDELRCCVDPTPAPSNCFATLLRRMTQNCLPLLLLLAGSAAVSCGARATYDSLPTSGAGGVSAAGGSAATGGEATVATGGIQGFALPPGTGGSTVIDTSGTVPCVKDSDGGTGAPLSMSDVQNIVKQCIVESTTRDDVLACIDTLNTSWQQSVEWLLNCSNCDDVARFLLLLMARCSQLPDQYSWCSLDPQSCMPIYAGVRLD